MMSTRLIYVFSFIVICLLLLISVYLQVFEGFVPCPLCTLQRICFALLGILFLIGSLLYTKRISCLLIHFLSILTSILGIFFSGRQIWLQHFPTASSSECGVSLKYMMQVFPLNEVIQKIFAGSAECTQRSWEFLSLSMPAWALIGFVLFLLLSIYLIVNKPSVII